LWITPILLEACARKEKIGSGIKCFTKFDSSDWSDEVGELLAFGDFFAFWPVYDVAEFDDLFSFRGKLDVPG
jgi:hypothetical protein